MAFFVGMPFPVQFFLAFIIVLGLIGATAWALRHFGAGRLGSGAVRGRQPRLAVIDYASVDGRRRLILVRRDNVEHLVMIGGPTDIVVESNIVRAAPGIAAPRAPAPIEPLPRAVASQDGAATNGLTNRSRPPQPEPVPRAPRNEPVAEEPVLWPLQQESRTPRDTLAALANELSARPSAPPRSRPQTNARPQPVESRPETRQEPRQEPHQESRPESRQDGRQDAREPRQEIRQEARQEPRQEPRLAPPQPAVESAASSDGALTDMAHQLEAALRKPAAKGDRSEANDPRPVPMPRPVPQSEPAAGADTPPAALPAAPAPAAPFPAPRPMRPNMAESKPPRSDAKPSGKTLYDNLEQEMASLLGRSSAKN